MNRIRRYDHVWNAPGVKESLPPTGFSALCLSHLTLSERQAIEQQQKLYQWAFELAKQKADDEFFHDWMI